MSHNPSAGVNLSPDCTFSSMASCMAFLAISTLPTRATSKPTVLNRLVSLKILYYKARYSPRPNPGEEIRPFMGMVSGWLTTPALDTVRLATI